jgi:hypothetical protein
MKSRGLLMGILGLALTSAQGGGFDNPNMGQEFSFYDEKTDKMYSFVARTKANVWNKFKAHLKTLN